MEKKTIIVITFFIATLSLTSCQTKEEKAQKAAYNYSYEMANYKLDEAEKYATEETINTTITTGKSLMQFVDIDYISSDTPAKIEVTKTEMTSDTSATVTLVKNTPIKKDMQFTVEVRKRDGKWLAHAPQRTH